MRQTLLSYLPDFLDRGEDTALMGRSGLRTVYWSYQKAGPDFLPGGPGAGLKGTGPG